MNTLIYYVTRVLKMPLLLICLGLLSGFSPLLFEKKVSLVFYLLITIIALFIPFFKNKLLLWRSIKTSSLGIMMIIIIYYFGYESQIWVYAIQIIGFVAATFFILDVDEQLKNYRRLIKKDMNTLSNKSFYKKLATSRCSVGMYFAVLDTVKKKKNNFHTMKRNFITARKTKDEISKIYKPWFFFPVTKETLWIKKLKDLRKKSPTRE